MFVLHAKAVPPNIPTFSMVSSTDVPFASFHGQDEYQGVISHVCAAANL